jgi:hypothetical protein
MSASTTNPNAIAFDQEEADFALVDAESAYRGVSALVELLGACQPGQQITGIFVHSLLLDVRMHLDNVVSSLRVPMVSHTFEAQELQ